MKTKRKTITITQEDINNGKTGVTTKCPAALALTRAFGRPMFIYKSFGWRTESNTDSRRMGNTPKKLFAWIKQFDRSKWNKSIPKPKPGKFIVTYHD